MGKRATCSDVPGRSTAVLCNLIGKGFMTKEAVTGIV
ncbi:hypothetical protein KIPB_015285, partial [Kipferlia bialata]|eukprot:g15285.t1